MKGLEMSSKRSSVNSRNVVSFISLIEGFCTALLLVAICNGCVSGREEWNIVIARNSEALRSTFKGIDVGEYIEAISPSLFAEVRVRRLSWDSAILTQSLISQIERGTYGKMGITFLLIRKEEFPGRCVADLSLEQGARLRDIWKDRILESLTTKYFSTDRDLLAAGLDGDGVDVYYVLMARDNSAEMGHADTVEIFVIDSHKRLVSKMKKEYGSRYPFRFIEQKTWNYDFLF